MFTEFQGFIGQKNDTLTRLFRSDLLDDINHQYMIAEYLPGYYLIGSDAALEGIFVAPDGRVVQIPFIPLSAQYEKLLFDSVEKFRAEFDRSFRDDSAYPLDRTRMAVHPIGLGGNPTDPANFKDAPDDIHVKATVYWNKVYAYPYRKTKRANEPLDRVKRNAVRPSFQIVCRWRK
jgi:hypothetical protein